MPKQKRKLTAVEKADKKRRREKYMTIFINGKQKGVEHHPTIDGMNVEDFIRMNLDSIWLHQSEIWEYIDTKSDDGTDSDEGYDN